MKLQSLQPTTYQARSKEELTLISAPHNSFKIQIYNKKVFALLYFCSVIDHRRRQKEVKKKKGAHNVQPGVSLMFLSFKSACHVYN